MGTSSDDKNAWLARLAPRSEMGAAVAALDWSTTPLGPPDEWPTELRAAVQLCLSTRFPVLLVWGPELVKIYNDAYRPILGNPKHPGALGLPAAQVWSEIWDDIEPLFAGVMSTGEPTWAEDQPFVVDRDGHPEECFFTFSYSPLYRSDGTVGGVLDIVTETTTAVLATRRVGRLRELSASLVQNTGTVDIAARAVAALSEEHGCVKGGDLYVAVDGTFTLIASNRRNSPVHRSPADFDTTGRLVVDQADGPRYPGEVAVVVRDAFGVEVGLVVIELVPHHPFDSGYRDFVGLVGETIGATLAAAVHHGSEVDEFRHIGDVLQAAMLKPASDFPTVAARYVPATGNLAVGGDRYDVVALADDRRALVVGDCVGHGLSAAAAMSQLRAAARALLVQGLSPAEMLVSLDRYALTVDGAHCATAACVIVDRSGETVTYCLAGHPPPLLVNGPTAVWLNRALGPPLGAVQHSDRADETLPLEDDCTLVMYTDGLIERRNELYDEGLARLMAATTELIGAGVHEMADALLGELVTGVPRDDVVLMIKRLPNAATSGRQLG